MSIFMWWFLFNILLIWAARRPCNNLIRKQKEVIRDLMAELENMGANPKVIHQHLHLHGVEIPQNRLTK